MYYIIAIPEAAIGIIVLLLLCLVWTGGLLVSQFWASLLYWAFFIIYIPMSGFAFLLYLVGKDDGNDPPVYIRILRFCCSFLLPFIAMIIVKRQIVDRYIYDTETEFPVRGTVLLAIIGAVVLLVVFFMIISRLNVFLGIAVWAVILVLSPTIIKDYIVEQIARHEVITVVTFETKKSAFQGIEGGDIYKATGNYYHNSGTLGDITKNKVEVIDDDGETIMLNRDSVKVRDFISRYDILMETNSDLSELLQSD